MPETKESVFLVEILYQQIFNAVDEQGEPAHGMKIANQSFTFRDANENKARQAAEKEMDRIQRYGLKLSGGSIIKSIILPSAIKQIGIIDLNKFEEEREKVAESLGSIEENIQKAKDQGDAAEELLEKGG